MYFELNEMADNNLNPSIIQVKNLAEAKEVANEIGKKNGFHHIHFHKWNAGTCSLITRTHSFKTHCVTVK